MRYTLISILFIFCTNLWAQRYSVKHAIVPAGLSFVSGASNGLHETLLHHYDAFERTFPHANAQYWNPQLSWRNKYQDGNPENGERYFGAKTFLVWTTDGYHLTNTIHRSTLFFAGVSIGMGEKRPWWHYGLDIGISFVAYSAGFHLVYSGLTLH